MKKIITLFTMILALVTSSYAQVKIIAKAGATLTNVSFNKDINDQFPGDFKYGSKAGFIAGFAERFPSVAVCFHCNRSCCSIKKGIPLNILI